MDHRGYFKAPTDIIRLESPVKGCVHPNCVSVSVQREMAPIYVMGRVDPHMFRREHEGTAGTLTLHPHALLSGLSLPGENDVAVISINYLVDGRPYYLRLNGVEILTSDYDSQKSKLERTYVARSRSFGPWKLPLLPWSYPLISSHRQFDSDRGFHSLGEACKTKRTPSIG